MNGFVPLRNNQLFAGVLVCSPQDGAPWPLPTPTTSFGAMAEAEHLFYGSRFLLLEIYIVRRPPFTPPVGVPVLACLQDAWAGRGCSPGVACAVGARWWLVEIRTRKFV
jgi:hypothetical protein